MDLRRPIPLYPHPPLSPSQTCLSDDYSYFPPAREHESSPDPPIYPTTSRSQTRPELLSDDFPPARVSLDPPIHSTTTRSHHRSSVVKKDPRRRSSPNQSESQRPRLPNKGLGSADILNTVELTLQHNKNHGPKSKRRLTSPDAADDGRRLKKYRLTSVYDEDMDWMKDKFDDIKSEIEDIKTETRDIKNKTEDIKNETRDIKNEIEDIKMCMMQIAEHLREEVDLKIEEVIHRLKQMS